jgi:hypothetical protein
VQADIDIGDRGAIEQGDEKRRHFVADAEPAAQGGEDVARDRVVPVRRGGKLAERGGPKIVRPGGGAQRGQPASEAWGCGGRQDLAGQAGGEPDLAAAGIVQPAHHPVHTAGPPLRVRAKEVAEEGDAVDGCGGDRRAGGRGWGGGDSHARLRGSEQDDGGRLRESFAPADGWLDRR